MNSRRFERTRFRSAADIREAVLVAVTRTHNSPRAFRSAGNASLALILPDLLLARSAQNDVPPFVGMTDHRRRSGRSHSIEGVAARRPSVRPPGFLVGAD